MELQDVVRQRRMVRSFQRRALPRAAVERILANAQRAPSAGFSQGWAFLVLEGYDETAPYWDAVGPRDRERFGWPGLLDAPLLVVCLSNKQAYLDRYAEPDKGWADRDERRWAAPYWDVDAGMAALLMLLTAVDEGLGGLFFAVPAQKVDRLRAAFGIPDQFRPVGTCAIGYEQPTSKRSPSLVRGQRPSTEVLHLGRW